MQEERIGGAGLLARIVAAVALVYGTYNPEGISYFHWTILPLVRGRAWPASGRARSWSACCC